MRLSQEEVEVIKSCCKRVFGNAAKVFLFGSRIDDSKRGGDIDLLIKTNTVLLGAERLRLKLQFLVEVKRLLGQQKIDVLIDAGQETDNVYATASKDGIEL